MPLELEHIAAAVIALLVMAVVLTSQLGGKAALLRKIERKQFEFVERVEQQFVVQPCVRCHEFEMKLIEVSPNGRSVHYQCQHCKKRTHAPAGTPAAATLVEAWAELRELIDAYNRKVPEAQRVSPDIEFSAPAAPLPFELTSRTPVPEAVRTEVWRRDGGACVECGSKQNLQFDHIIPVSRGGATSARNLQLLCQNCNQKKSDRI
jgi:hypothetical protein